MTTKTKSKKAVPAFVKTEISKAIVGADTQEIERLGNLALPTGNAILKASKASDSAYGKLTEMIGICLVGKVEGLEILSTGMALIVNDFANNHSSLNGLNDNQKAVKRAQLAKDKLGSLNGITNRVSLGLFGEKGKTSVKRSGVTVGDKKVVTFKTKGRTKGTDDRTKPSKATSSADLKQASFDKALAYISKFQETDFRVRNEFIQSIGDHIGLQGIDTTKASLKNKKVA